MLMIHLIDLYLRDSSAEREGHFILMVVHLIDLYLRDSSAEREGHFLLMVVHQSQLDQPVSTGCVG
jgi:hypothetical protein